MKLNQVSHRFYGLAKCRMGKRSLDAIKWIVIHDTEGDTAEGGAYTLISRPDGSAHEIVGPDVTYVLAPPTEIMCHVGGFNTPTYGIEQPGKASYTRAQWMERWAQLNRLAWRVAYWCVKLGLPPRYRTAEDLVAGKPGYTTHLQVTLSRLGSTTHTDPGRAFPFEGRRGVNALIRAWYWRFKVKLPKVEVV